jgi:hypothetical protein
VGIAIGAIVVVGLAFAAGYFLGVGQDLYRVRDENETKEKCSDACTQWKQRRLETCTAEKDAKAALDAMSGLQAAYLAAMVAFALLIAAGIAASLIPLGQIAAIGFFAAAAVVFVLAAGIMGAIARLAVTVQSRNARATEARAREIGALDMVSKLCTPEQADACMLGAPPCPE